MYFSDEKDYIMRMIKEMVKILFSLICGKKYVSVEFEKENKYEVSGKNLKSFLDMIDSGQSNIFGLFFYLQIKIKIMLLYMEENVEYMI